MRDKVCGVEDSPALSYGESPLSPGLIVGFLL